MEDGTGNGWVKPVIVGVAIFVLGVVIVGSTTSTIANTVGRNVLQVEVKTLKEDVDEQKANVAKIPVMASQITDIKADVRLILEKLNK
jgi:uncharacterized membrane-anchored protein YhcB (DUF1043 family)